jgi:predicted MarR family transcription regulator
VRWDAIARPASTPTISVKVPPRSIQKSHYRDLREKLLVDQVKSLGLDEARISEIAALMRVMSGQYDQASRAATSY